MMADKSQFFSWEHRRHILHLITHTRVLTFKGLRVYYTQSESFCLNFTYCWHYIRSFCKHLNIIKSLHMHLGRTRKAANQVTNRLCGIWHHLRVIIAEVIYSFMSVYFFSVLSSLLRQVGLGFLSENVGSSRSWPPDIHGTICVKGEEKK